MPVLFWIKRFLLIALGSTALLVVLGLLRGRGLEGTLIESALWGAAVAAIVVGTRLYRSRQGQQCAICKDTPEGI